MSLKSFCLKALEWLPTNARTANLKNKPLEAWDDSVIIKAAKGAMSLLRMAGSPRFMLRGKETVPLVEAAEGAQGSLNTDLAGFLKNFTGIITKIDERGDLLVQGQKLEQVYEPAKAIRLKDFLGGDIKVADLTASESSDFIPLKAELVRLANATDVGRITRARSTIFNIDMDLMTPIISKVFNPKNPASYAYEFSSIIPKQIFLKVLAGQSKEAVTASEFIRAAIPQLIKKEHFDPVIRMGRELLPNVVNPLEARYIATWMQRLAGKKTLAQQTVDSWINLARRVMGKEDFQISPSAQFSSYVTRNFYRGMMWMNPSMAALNLTQTINTFAKEGTLRTLGAIKTMTTKDGRLLASEARTLGQLDNFWRADAQNLMDKADHVGYFFFNNAEYWNRGVAFHAGLSRFLEKEGITMQEFIRMGSAGSKQAEHELYKAGMKVGLDAANETQFMYSIAHTSPMLNGPLGKLMASQFLSFPLRQSEFLINNWRSDNGKFLARYLAYTGVASSAAWYGAGLAIGKQVGGLGNIPEAKDLFDEGKYTDAFWATAAGFTAFLPDDFQIKRGFTPFNTVLLDTLNLPFSEEPEVAWARWGRDMSNIIPGMMQARRMSDAYLTYANNGKSFTPGSAGAGKLGSLLEGTSVPIGVSSIVKQMLGNDPSSFSGDLSKVDSSGFETAKSALGLRSVEAAKRSQVLETQRQGIAEIRSRRRALSDQALQALETGGNLAEIFQQGLDEGVFENQKDLERSLGAAFARRVQPKEVRQLKNAPRAFRDQE